MLLNVFFRTFNNIIDIIEENFKNIYKNSSFYEKKISKTLEIDFNYKPSPHLLSSLINYQNKKYKIDELDLNIIWKNNSKSREFKKLKEFWTDDLILGIPFYDSFLYNNKYTDSQCIPDFSFNNPVFLIEDNDTLLDKDMGKAVEKFCEGKYETVKAQSVYYRRNEDFGAYMTARCINKRTTTEKPNLEGMCSDQFSIEAWCKKTGSKITGKPRRAIEEKAEAPEEEIRSD